MLRSFYVPDIMVSVIVLPPNKTLLVTGLSTGLAREPRMRVPLLPQCFHNLPPHRELELLAGVLGRQHSVESGTLPLRNAVLHQVNWRLWTLNHNRYHADNSVHHPMLCL